MAPWHSPGQQALIEEAKIDLARLAASGAVATWYFGSLRCSRGIRARSQLRGDSATDGTLTVRRVRGTADRDKALSGSEMLRRAAVSGFRSAAD